MSPMAKTTTTTKHLITSKEGNLSYLRHTIYCMFVSLCVPLRPTPLDSETVLVLVKCHVLRKNKSKRIPSSLNWPPGQFSLYVAMAVYTCVCLLVCPHPVTCYWNGMKPYGQ